MRKTRTLLAVLILMVSGATAQERTISGKITSSKDTLAIPGVAVVVVGTTIGTTSDANGNYSLNVSPDAKQLKFSGIGLKAKTIDIGASDNIDLAMDPDVLKLNEVVITSLAIEREKRSLGYATQQVSGADLNTGGNTNPIGALQGKVSGVNITSNSGAPGSAQRIVIRGGSSITRNNQALMIVDGVPIDNSNNRPMAPSNNYLADDLNNQVDYGNRGNDLNPNDIESVSVLKGPAATALYGARASNGAIIITTKKGRRTTGPGNSKMEVTFNTNVTFSQVLKLPEFQNEFGQGDRNGIEDDRRENFSWGLPFDGKLRPWGQQINGQQRVKPYSAIEDNVKDFYTTGVAYNNNLSFSGGSQKSSYFLSLSTLNSKGIVPTSRYNKYNLRFNGGSELANHFKTNLSVNFSTISSVAPTGGQQNASIFDQLIQTPRDIPIVDSKNLDDPFNGYNDITGTYGFYGAYSVNPYFVLNSYKNTGNIDRLLGNFSVTYDGWEWLSITNRFGGDVYSDRRYQKWKKYSYLPADESGLYTSLNSQNDVGKYSEDLYNNVSYDNDLMLTFKRKLTNTINASLLIGQNIRQRTLNNTFAATNELGGLNLAGYYNLDNTNGQPVGKNTLTQNRNIGYYGDLNLSYKSLIFLELTGRADKSSTLPPDNNTYFYPSASVSFVFSELFPSNMKEGIWSYGKLRGSYAKVGNDADPYLTTDVFEPTVISSGFGNTTFPLGNVAGFTVLDQSRNNEITPEFTTAFEVGLDLAFLKDRLSIDFSYYQNKSTDLILSLPIAPSSGFTSKVANVGEVENKGIELGVKGTPVLTNSGFRWDLFGTYTKNENKVISLYQGVDQITLGGFSGMAIVAKVGEPYGSFYATDLLTDPQGRVVVDADGLPILTTVPILKGSYMPKFIASFGTALTYKKIRLSVLFDMKEGGVFFSRTKDIMGFVGTSKETTVNNREPYVWPNSVQQMPDGSYVPNTVPHTAYNYYTGTLAPPGQAIVDASYVKMREVSISYDLPLKWISKTPFGGATVAVFGNNLFIWTPEENQYSDPEQNSSGSSNAQGFEYGSSPSQRNFGVDLKVTF